MPFTPDSPFPKTRGHVIKSKDWNDAITELQRLDNAKVNKAGDNITGPLTISGDVGIGTTPRRRLHVEPNEMHSGGSGAGYSFGNRETTTFVEGPSNGERWVWYAAGTNARLWSGSDKLAVTPTGNVGIGTTTPADRLDVAGNLRVLTGSNPIRFTAGWSGFAPGNNQAEISNDTSFYKSLMIVGNNSGGAGRRVQVWDVLDIQGDVTIRGKHAFRGSDPWLRLNQDGAFTSGVHTPGVFAPMSLNVGGVGGWGNPGAGNAWIAGSVTIAGNLGTHGYPPTAHTPGWGGGIRTYDLEVEATAWVRNGVQTGARDLAENFLSDADLDPGDVVCMGYEEDSVVASEEPEDDLVLGVVSTKPGLLLNSERDVDIDGKLFPVALCGRVPCKVVDENGPIERGDLLTSSSTPGHAMKASSVMMDGREIHRPGTIIGKALGSLESGSGTIEVFVTSR